jgi:hypothetical protein
MLLEFRVKGEPIPGPYLELYELLLTPVLWERKENIQPLVRLLTAYVSKMNPSEMPKHLQLVKIFLPRFCHQELFVNQLCLIFRCLF